MSRIYLLFIAKRLRLAHQTNQPNKSYDIIYLDKLKILLRCYFLCKLNSNHFNHCLFRLECTNKCQWKCTVTKNEWKQTNKTYFVLDKGGSMHCVWTYKILTILKNIFYVPTRPISSFVFYFFFFVFRMNSFFPFECNSI